ncbi:hypothetical protein [Candidatus Pelagibacter sp. HIMB109]|uniref:hypothetical protein n=1 Tax=Candidatus Pelagibacter sp. HIMB109 TaxID=3415412 RepID=UPI003F82E33C
MMDDKKLIKPEYLSSSIGSVMKYTFDTFEELEKFFLASVASFKKNKVKTKVIGRSILVFKT